MVERDLTYEGPDDQYHPAIGGRNENDGPTSRYDNGPTSTYASLDYIRSLINLILSAAQVLMTGMEERLNTLAMPVTTELGDETLQSAHAVEWPADLGPPRATITYQYYKMLGVKDSKSAQYIRRRYEDALRSETGANAIDLLPIVQLIREETFAVQSFISTYIGSMDDTAEFRTTELVQDWLESARNWTGAIQQMFTSPGTGSLSTADIQQNTASTARQAQALFKVKLNVLNDQIGQSLQVLSLTHNQFAETFFTQFLGPATTMRLQVNRKIYPVSSSMGKDLWHAAGALDTNLTIAHTDQLRRNNIFTQKVEDTLALVASRDTYRTYMTQLAAIGKALPTGTAGSTTKDTAVPDETVAFQQIMHQTTTATDTNRFLSTHDQLQGRENPAAHTQYLLKAGDTISGNVSVANGVTIDGVDLSTHTHSGNDGSSAIDGSSIVPGTLNSSTVDLTQAPAAPINVQLVRQTGRTLPTGLTVVDFDLSWDGDTNFTYEINVAPLPG